MLNAELRDDRLVATHAVGMSGRATARWYEFDVSSGTPSLTQEGNIDPGPGIHTYFPSIAINDKGDLGMTYMQSSSSEFVSMYATGQAFGSVPGTMSPPVLVKAGDENYFGSRGGDYSGVSVDPVTDSFWAFNEVSLSGPAPNPLWSTWIGEFEVAPNEDQDWFEIAATAGSNLLLTTTTPFDGPNAVVNDLDPILELYDPFGNLVDSNDNSAGDGRNAVISYTPLQTGDYRVVVAAASGSVGTYELTILGDTYVNQPPMVVSSNPNDGLKLASFPTTVTLDFSEPILGSSVNGADFLIGGLTATSVEFVDGNTLELGVNPAANLGDGTYVIDLAAAALTDYQALGNTTFSSTFDVDTAGPIVAATLWNGAALPSDKVLNPGALTFSAAFNEGLFAYESARRGLRNPGTEDVELTETVTGQSYVPVMIAYDTITEVFTAEFEPLPEGNYELRLISGNGAFEDEVGNDLDGDPLGPAPDGTPTGDGNPGGDYVVEFTIDINGVFTGLTPFERLAPLGDFVADSLRNSGVISSASDDDAFSFFAEGGETVAAVVTPGEASTTVSVEYNGTTLTAAAPGETVAIPATLVTTDGTQTITVSANGQTDYRIDFYRNASIDALQDGGPVDLISSSLLNGGDLFAAVGASSGSAGEPFFSSYNDPGSFIDISATGTALGLTDDGEATINTTVSNSIFPGGTITIGNNGGVVAGAGVDIDFTNASLPTTDFGAALLPFWDDIHVGSGDVYWEERSVAGINTLIVQWDDRPHYNNIGSATFQLQLFDSGTVAARYVYPDVDFGDSGFDGGASATIGWQSGSGTAVTYSFNTASLSNGDVLDLIDAPAALDIDEFNFPADMGDVVDVALVGDGTSFANATLELIDPFGTVVATAAATGDFDLGALDYTRLRAGHMSCDYPRL